MKKLHHLSALSLLLFCMFCTQNIHAQQIQLTDTVNYTIPQLPQDISPLLDGEQIPSVKLTDINNNIVDLNKTISSKPTILIFYRGGWCPFCSAQLSGLQEIYPSLVQKGYQLIAVSTDKPDNLKETLNKQNLDYTLLSDADLTAAKQFGIAYKAPKGYWDMLPKTTGGKDVDLLLPVPSVFIVSRKGTISFEYINPDFKQRMDAGLLKVVAENIYDKL